MDETMLSSSPDPLNDSPTFHNYSPPKPRRRSSRVSFPLQGSSPKKQTFELDVGNEISPQKIRVTVEAGSSDREDSYGGYMDRGSPSPSRAKPDRRRERTTTTTVPVKGLSDSGDETLPVATTTKARRGRPRKSLDTPVPAKKRGRPSTPNTKGKRKSIGDLVDGDDKDDINYQLGKNVDIGRGKGRSRSRSTKADSRKSTGKAKQNQILDDLVTDAPAKKGRGRLRKSAVSNDAAVPEEESGRVDNESSSGLAEMSGGLGPTESDNPSPSSHAHPRTTSEEAEANVTIASFDPGNETPRHTGWSSPRVVATSVPPSSRRISDGYLSPMLSPIRAPSSHGEEEKREYEDIHAAAISPSNHQDEFSDDYEEVHFEEQEEVHFERNEGTEFPGNDTIFESEGFSMISVDSLPSLKHLSPAGQPEEVMSGKKKSPLSSQVVDTNMDDIVQDFPAEVMKTVISDRQPQNRSLLSVQNLRQDDSFSSIPPEILEAATPARKTLISKLLTKNHSRLEDSFSSIPSEILKAATPARVLPKRDNSARSEKTHNDSFSAVPSAVLDAATPAAIHPPRPPSSRLSVPESRSRPTSSSGQAERSPDSRLPTPEVTPSPPTNSLSNQLLDSSVKAVSKEAPPSITKEVEVNDSVLSRSHLPSSPLVIAPRKYTYAAHLRQQRQLDQDMTQTPSIVFSSPALPPPMPPLREPSLVPSLQLGPRPSLSPIARTGRALHDLQIPSSPRSRSLSLGSPFKSPSTDRRSVASAARDSAPSPILGRRVGPLPRLDLNGQFSVHSSQIFRESTGSNHQDDPFSSPDRNQRSPSPEDKETYSLELPQSHRYSDSHLTNPRSQFNSIRSVDAMSWQPEEELRLPLASAKSIAKSSPGVNETAENAIGQSGGLTWQERAAAERAAVKKQIMDANSSKVIVLGSDDSNHEQDDDDDDEDFGLLLETLNSSSPAPTAQEQEDNVRETIEKPRRSKLPSPWRQNSKRLVYSDELSRLSTPAMTEKIIPKPSNEIKPQHSIPVQRVAQNADFEASMEESIDLSEWHIPQKSNFKPRSRAVIEPDLSAMLTRSPLKDLPVPPREPQNHTYQTAYSSSRVQSVQTQSESTRTTVETSTNTQNGFTPIGPKIGFQPRPRADSPEKRPLIPRIFGGRTVEDVQRPTPEVLSSSTVSRALTNSSPSRTNTLFGNRASAAQRQTSVESQHSPTQSLLDEEEQENQRTKARVLNWTKTLHLSSHPIPTPLPSVISSPTKSCFRSPLKPPAGLRLSNNSGADANPSPSKAVAFASSSPEPEPTPKSLSSTTWTRDHWVLLEMLRKSWDPTHQKGTPEPEGEGTRNSMRVVSKLLGRKISNGPLELVLEQWHLEVVDEFRSLVPGWEEKKVALRVFGLIKGKEWGTLKRSGYPMEGDKLL